MKSLAVPAHARAYVGRLAPSPTGLIHLGIARTGLAAWLDARAHDGSLRMRMEDIDLGRTVAGSADSILLDFEWLGLTWDGPVMVQSERFELYQAALEGLTQRDRTFPCTCSRKEIALASSAPHGPSDEGPRYPGTCRQGALDKPGRRPSVRLRTRPTDLVSHTDRLLGPLDQDVDAQVGDFVLKRADGMWAYQMAVTVDDLAQGITCIVRGDDLASSTPRQLLLRRLLDHDAPPLQTLHVPLMLDADGRRMAKRAGSTTVAQHREAGLRPQALIGQLAASLELVPEGTEARPDELIEAWRQRYIHSPAAT